MRLILTIVGDNAAAFGRDARKEFGLDGCVLGRGASCTWRLPDSTNTLSSRHAVITHNGAGFVITDTSTNGVYINTVDVPLGRGNSAPLSQGDTLYVGDYVISVAIAAEPVDDRRRLGLTGSQAVRVGRGATGFEQGNTAPPPSIVTANPLGINSPVPVDPRAAIGAPPVAPGASANLLGAGPTAKPPADPLVHFDRPNGGLAINDNDLLAPPSPAAGVPAAQPPMGGAPAVGPALRSGFGPSGGGLGAPTPPFAPSAASPPFPAARPNAGSIPDSVFDFGLPPSQPTPPVAKSVGPAPIPAPPPMQAPQQMQAPQVVPAKPKEAPKGAFIPDDLDLSDLLGGSPPGKPASPAPHVAPAAAPSAPPVVPIAAPSPTPALPPQAGANPLANLAPTRSPPDPGIMPAPPPQRRPLAPALTNDLVALRKPGEQPPLPDGRVLDPLAVLRQRAADRQTNLEQTTFPVPGAGRAAPVPMPAAGGPTAGGDDLQRFWAALGIDPQSIPPEHRQQVLAELGAALRETADGLISVLAARSSVKSEFQIEQTRLQAGDNNPFKFLKNGRDALRKGIAREHGYLSLSRAIREGFHDIRAHEVAAMVAMRSAIGNMLTRLSPPVIETEGTTSGLFGRRVDKTKLWDRFIELHASMVNDLDRTTRAIVADEFARTYEDQIARLKQGEGEAK